MKTRIANYTFDAIERTVTFNDYDKISLDAVLLVTNAADGIIIYTFADPAKGGTVSGNKLILSYDTSLMSNTDPLIIFYDDINRERSLDALTWAARKLPQLLKPLQMVTGSGSNRLSVDINSLPTLGTVTTVTTVTTVSNVANQTNMGGVAAFSLIKDSARNAYSNSIRSKITFS